MHPLSTPDTPPPLSSESPVTSFAADITNAYLQSKVDAQGSAARVTTADDPALLNEAVTDPGLPFAGLLCCESCRAVFARERRPAYGKTVRCPVCVREDADNLQVPRRRSKRPWQQDAARGGPLLGSCLACLAFPRFLNAPTERVNGIVPPVLAEPPTAVPLGQRCCARCEADGRAKKLRRHEQTA